MKTKTKQLFAVMLILIGLLSLTSCKKSDPGDDLPGNTVFGVDDLPGKKIGVQLGTTGDIYVSAYEGDEDNTKVERYSKAADAVEALLQGKLDAVVVDEQPAKAFSTQRDGLMILEQEFANEEYAAVISKDNPELLRKFNRALSELNEDGTLNRIIRNYIPDEKTGETEPFTYEQKVTGGEKLKMFTNAYFPPYEYYQNGKIVGIDVDIAMAAADKMGYELKIENVEFDSIINAISSGKGDIGLAGFTVTEERMKEISFSDCYAQSKQVILVRDDDAIRESTGFLTKLYNNFIKEQRWKYLLQGLVVTILITIVAILIGFSFGFILALIRVTHDKNGSLKIPNFFVKLYVTVIRGTPVMVQLLIIYFVIFASVDINKVLVAIIAFGINSSAYLCEVIRSGIMSIDEGQFEAGKSLGLSYSCLMNNVIIPQAIKNVLPAIGNEFIALLKETSIAGYIGLQDLTKGGEIIRSITYEPLLPLLSVALIYLILVLILTALVGKLERRLKKNER